MVNALLLVIIAAVSGLAMRLALGAVGQRWATTYHSTMTYLLLPVIGMAITRTISGNIALSLGMIGALSIVRFRHPVKSPLELVVFFLLLTVGVTLTVDVRLGVLLTGYAVVTIFAVDIFQKMATKRGYRTFAVSFSEGEPLNILEVTSSAELPELLAHPDLVLSSWIESSSEHDYRIASRSRQELEAIATRVREAGTAQRIELRLAQ